MHFSVVMDYLVTGTSLDVKTRKGQVNYFSLFFANASQGDGVIAREEGKHRPHVALWTRRMRGCQLGVEWLWL